MKPLYEDNHLLVLYKEAGLLTQPSGTDQDSLESQAKVWIKEVKKKSGSVFLEAVHRLDKDVAGIVLFAKTSKALSRLQKAQREQLFEKIYYAKVEGSPPKSGTLKNRLKHSSHRAIPSSSGKDCLLHFERISQGILRIHLVTGRYHQIRAQLALAGYPIWGDQKYGSKLQWPKGIALLHGEMSFPHPVSNERLRVQLEDPCKYFA